MQKYHCWFSDEGENKGDQILDYSAKEAGRVYYIKWLKEAKAPATVFVRSVSGVTQWVMSVENAQIASKQLNTKES